MKGTLADQLGEHFGKKRFDGAQTRVFQAATPDNIIPGTILFANLSSDEGLVIKAGYEERQKFFVVVGTDNADYIVGSLLINTHKAFSFMPAVAAAQVKICKADYPGILDHDSWLDCSNLFRIKKSKILSDGGFCGMLTASDWQKARQALIATPTISEDEKIEFGIILQ